MTREGRRDFLDAAARSERMSRIRARGNQTTELRLAALLRRLGLVGWRRGVRLIGRPDFVYRKQRLAVFVDGCFWHGCPLHYIKPIGNADFWVNKVQSNRKRDRAVSRALSTAGWRVLRIWEHELRGKNIPRLARRLRRAVIGSHPTGTLRQQKTPSRYYAVGAASKYTPTNIGKHQRA